MARIFWNPVKNNPVEHNSYGNESVSSRRHSVEHNSYATMLSHRPSFLNLDIAVCNEGPSDDGRALPVLHAMELENFSSWGGFENV